MSKPLLIQVVGPYRAETINAIRENVDRAREAMVEILKRGHFVICPHTMTAFLDGLVSDEHFLANAQRFLEIADAILLIDGWNQSEGSLAEKHKAEHLKSSVKTIFYDIADVPEVG